MAFDEALAQRIRQALAGRQDMDEKRMFGGVAFMVAGRMCCGVHRDRLILRLPVDDADSLLRTRKVREFDPGDRKHADRTTRARKRRLSQSAR